MTVVPIGEPEANVFVDGHQVVIRNMVIDDADLVQFVGTADDPELELRDITCLGANVKRITQTSVDVAVVEKQFADLEHRFDEDLTMAVEAMNKTADSYLNPKTGAFREMLDEVESNFDAAFDPDSKVGVLAKFEGILTGGHADMEKTIRDLVDPGSPKSPLARFTADLKELRDITIDIGTKLAVGQTEAEVLELTAVKGRKFEEVVFESVAGVASLFGDEPTPVGDQTGTVNKCGDILLTVNPDDTPGATGRIVVEVKDRKLSMRETHAELERG